MNKTKTLLFAVAISSSLAGYAADTFGTIQKLPLKVSAREDAHHVDGTWGTYGQNELDFSGTKGQKSGGTIVDYVFNEVPGKLSVNLTVPTTCSKKHTHKVYFEIYEDSNTAPDNHGTQVKKVQVATTVNEDILLSKSTRRVRFYYHKGNSGLFESGCDYTYNLKFDVTKSIEASEAEVTFSGLLGEVKDTITINYSYPQGDLVLENGSDADFKLRKLSEESEAGKEGTISVEISYEPQAAKTGVADIIIRDSQHADNFATVKVTAEATELFKPDAPASAEIGGVSYNSAFISWAPVSGAVSYKVNLYNKDKELVTSFSSENESTKISDLTRGEIYYISIVSIADNGIESFESKLYNFETMSDFGQQLKNAGFEAWEAIASLGQEPLSWSSFATIREDFIFASFAKAEQVKQSEEKRPGTKGSYSAEIYSRNAMGPIWANGNLTTGRINAGSAEATDAAKNYNFSDLSNPAHFQTIDIIPDSATLWVKYVPFNAENIGKGANVSFVIHGDDGNASNLVKEPSTTDNPLRYSVAESGITTIGEWTRISIPFEKKHEAAENMTKYILVSLATNGSAGFSTGGKDVVYVDDVVLIYPNNVTIEDPATTVFEEGDQITIPFTLSGSFTPTNANFAMNKVTLQLSDENGNFDNARTISEPLSTDESGVITGIIPSDIPAGSDYRVRAFITYGNKGSEANATALTINGTGTPTGIESNTQQPVLSLYPNPARENIVIKGASEADYRIYNIAGRTLRSGNGNLSEGIYVADLTQGVYFIEVKCNGMKSVLRFIKE